MVCAVGLSRCASEADKDICNTCRVANKLNVHIISHTHNDPGWLKTYQEYFDGNVKLDVQVGVPDGVLTTPKPTSFHTTPS